ncbi:hypothetical protein C7S14_7559 [Burkholderia cepacia]|nr:hypothetical protein C7S14_7559 [Burkholderia cepacia]
MNAVGDVWRVCATRQRCIVAVERLPDSVSSLCRDCRY